MKPEDIATRFPALASELARLNHDDPFYTAGELVRKNPGFVLIDEPDSPLPRTRVHGPFRSVKAKEADGTTSIAIVDFG